MYKEIAVVIPAYNEEKKIGEVVKEAKKLFEKVIVINDGSTDKTEEIAKNQGAIVISHSKCMGKGTALKTAFSYIISEGIPAFITIDGDGQHLISDSENFIEKYKKIKRGGIFIGKRKMVSTKMSFLRRITNTSMSLLISLLSFQWIPDTQCGYRLIKKDVIEKVKLITSHYETESELLIKASWKGFRIVSVPITTVYRDEKSKIKPGRDTLRFFKMILVIIFPQLSK
ncbi:MAG TPA: glycosyltransferase family 2 protein [bacterium]|mgnify:FL=1|nr:glycosyltransferase family 2 protein [bacterium]